MFKKSTNLPKKRKTDDERIDDLESKEKVDGIVPELIRKKFKNISASVTQGDSVSVRPVDPDAVFEATEPERPKRAFSTSKPSSAQVDLQASLCKDFYETGYCGFGDSCKFLHDRPSEGIAAWEAKAIESVPKTESRKRQCAACSTEWKGCTSLPCRTECKHYFCEECFFARCKKKCTVCGKATNGVCHAAEELLVQSDSE
jgi:hypothetical protein